MSAVGFFQSPDGVGFDWVYVSSWGDKFSIIQVMARPLQQLPHISFFNSRAGVEMAGFTQGGDRRGRRQVRSDLARPRPVRMSMGGYEVRPTPDQQCMVCTRPTMHCWSRGAASPAPLRWSSSGTARRCASGTPTCSWTSSSWPTTDCPPPRGRRSRCGRWG